MEEFTQIRIPRSITDQFLQSDFKKQNENVSLTMLVTSLLEMFFRGEIVRLDDANYNEISRCAKIVGKTNKEVVNMVLEKIEIIAIANPEKVKVDLTEHRKVKVERKQRFNAVTNWE